MREYTEKVAWFVIKAVYLDEIERREIGIKKRAALRLGLHSVNGFTRKINQIPKYCPELAEDIERTLNSQ